MKTTGLVSVGVMLVLAAACKGDGPNPTDTRANDSATDFPTLEVGTDSTPATPDQSVPADVESADVPDDLPVAPARPKISTITPGMVAPGQTVTVDGSHFGEAPKIFVGRVAVAPIEANDTRLSFQLPRPFPADACMSAFEVVVRTPMGGASDPAVLTVQQPPPMLDALPDPVVRASRSIVLTGSNLTGVTAKFSGATLITRVESDSRVVVELPRETALGKGTLEIAGRCGLAKVVLEVLAAPPRILMSEPATRVGTDGVLYLYTDVLERSIVTAVKLGDDSVPIDGIRARWHPNDKALLAVRIPARSTVGMTSLALLGSTGVGDAVSLEIFRGSPLFPPGPDGILFPPATGVNKPTFPIATTSPFFPAGENGPLPSNTVSWSYDISSRSVPDPALPPSSECAKRGTIGGVERYCVAPCPPGVIHSNGCTISPGGFTACHPMVGAWRLDTTTNTVEMTIDRTSSGGIKELYRGGWMPISTAYSPDPAEWGSTHLVLRSTQTGVQLRISHPLSPRCNSY